LQIKRAKSKKRRKKERKKERRKPYFLVLPISPTTHRPSIQIHEPMEAIRIQTTTASISNQPYFLFSLQRRGEESSEMEQISIIERFPYPFQVSHFI
jgi:hypothetical protein